jgi:hypothetical protein
MPSPRSFPGQRTASLGMPPLIITFVTVFDLAQLLGIERVTQTHCEDTTGISSPQLRSRRFDFSCLLSIEIANRKPSTLVDSEVDSDRLALA